MFPNKDLKDYTRKEFETELEKNLNINADCSSDPRFKKYHLRDAYSIDVHNERECHPYENCSECWMQSLRDFKFKGE